MTTSRSGIDHLPHLPHLPHSHTSKQLSLVPWTLPRFCQRLGHLGLVHLDLVKWT
jgi:hypothetical protein